MDDPPRLKRLLTPRRLVRLGGVTLAQVGVQGIGFLAAIVLVREMAPAQYGWFTLANSMVMMAAVLGDLGLSSAVLAVGGRLGAGAEAVATVLREARALQVPLAVVALAASGAATAGLLWHQAMPSEQVAVVCALVVGCAWWQLRATLDLSAARLLGQVSATQGLELGVHLLRLALVGLAAWSGRLDAALACAAGLAATFAWHGLLRRLLHRARSQARAEPATRPALWDHLRQQAPNSLYFLFSSQAALWLVGVFGDTSGVAEVGALSRLAAVFVIVGTVVAALALPYFARHREAAEFAGGVRAVNLFFAFALALLLLAGWTWPRQMLWVLGGHYGELHAELLWMLLASTLSAWAGVLYAIGCARGWVMPFWVAAPLGLLALVATAACVDVGTVRGSFIVNTGMAATGLLSCMVYLAWRLRRLRDEPEPARLAATAP